MTRAGIAPAPGMSPAARGGSWRRRACAALAISALACAGAARAEAGLSATRELVRRLAAGRGEVAIAQRETDALGEVGTPRQGTLALEPPDRMKLALVGGEVLTVRRDGGEWLQPSLGQMIRFGTSGAGAATHLWGLLLGRAQGAIETPRGASGWRLRFPAEDGALDSVHVDLGPDQLPRRILAWPAAGGRFEARLSGWKFGRAAGVKAFSQRAPKGIEVVPLEP